MPALPHLDDAAIADIYALLAASARGGGAGNGGGSRQAGGRNQNATEPAMPEGPVVASGGVTVPAAGPRKPMDYPQGYTGPKAIFVESNNWGVGVPDLMTPPWSSIVAYDLNEGKIKWRVPLGNDDKIPGSKNLGTPNGSQGKGMVVTSTVCYFPPVSMVGFIVMMQTMETCCGQAI
ncbi:MAG: hypothetical protein WDN26_18920 [Chitinophagaceae bacterium]